MDGVDGSEVVHTSLDKLIKQKLADGYGVMMVIFVKDAGAKYVVETSALDTGNPAFQHLCREIIGLVSLFLQRANKIQRFMEGRGNGQGKTETVH